MSAPTSVWDRIKEPFLAIARSAFPRIDYLALYPGTVVIQRGANSIDVQCDNPRLPAFANLPVFLGEPGVTVQVAAGARVLVGFQGADPQLPFVALWANGATLASMNIAGGTNGAARVGDAVGFTTEMGTWMGQVAGVCNGVTPGAVTPTPPLSFGTITAGSDVVEIG